MIDPAGMEGPEAAHGPSAGIVRLAAVVVAIACLASLATGPAPGQTQSPSQNPSPSQSPPLPDSDAPLAEPVVRADATLTARRATAWQRNERVRYLLLENEVRFELGAYGFAAERAVVRIVIEPRPGRAIHHLALYLDQARALRGRGPVTAEGERLLVTASITGDVRLETDLMRPVDDPDRLQDVAGAEGVALIEAALARMRRRDERLAGQTLPAPDEPLWDDQAMQRRAARQRRVELPTTLRVEPPPMEPVAPDELTRIPAEDDGTGAVDVPPDAAGPRLPTSIAAESGVLPVAGTVRFAADRVVFERGDRESHLMLIGDVRLFYDDHANDRQVVLQTERAVVFLPGRNDQGNATDEDSDSDTDFPEPTSQVEAEIVRGVYLEDNAVITDGRYTVRAPRIFYDLPLNQAILLEAVAYAYDVRLNVPIYMRADVMRQTSRRSFEAERALITTSAFAEPHFAIGARRLTLEQRETPEGEPRPWVTARGTTFRALDVPVLYWPYVTAPAVAPPIRAVSAGYSDRVGAEVRTQWDLFALAGADAPEHTDATFNLDYRGRHGGAVGLDFEYDPEPMVGTFEGYLLPYDTGTDRRDVEHDGDTRGFVHWQHRHDLADDWNLRLETAYVSDETFLEEFFRSEAHEARPYETSFYLQKQAHDWQFDLLAKSHLSDFTPQLAQLQTPGYRVEKMPELGYYRIGTGLWDNRLTWYSENRFSRVRADFGEDTPADRGFDDGEAQALFGLPDNDTSFDDAADAANFPDDALLRFDTRQEITAPIAADGFDITPYAAGRFTAYDEDFEAYSGESDQHRLVGSVGTRMGTQFHRTYDVDNELLNLDGLRHIVEPGVDLFYIDATIDREDLPVFDPEIEGITEGAGVRFGLTNTFQTRRGGAGRSRSVDWITLQTDVILREDDDAGAAIPRYYGYRPEFSRGGDHFYMRLLWMVSDTFGLTSEVTHNLENDSVAQWRVGGQLDHTPQLNSFVTYTETGALDSRLLTYGFGYQLTTKYRVDLRHQVDFSDNDSRRLRVTLERRVPQARLRIFADYDHIDDEQMVGVVFVPEGFGSAPGPAGSAMFGR